jgi:uncharacterized membrane protein
MLYMVIHIKTQEIISILFGIVLVISGVYVLVYEPDWVTSVSGAMGGLIGAGVALILITFWQYRSRVSGELREDERDYRIAEKASFRTFQVTFILQGFLFAVLGIFTIQLPAQPVVGLLFAITGVSYVVFFYWYRNKM